MTTVDKTPSDAELFSRMRQGEDGACSELLTRYRRGLLSLIRRLGVPPPDDEDVLQQALVRFVRHRAEIGSPQAFLVTAVRRLCSNHHRDARRRRGLIEGVLGEIAPGRETAELRIVRALDVRRALDSTDPRCRELVLALVVEERSYAEVAARTGIPRNSLGPLVGRCLRRVRTQLGAGVA